MPRLEEIKDSYTFPDDVEVSFENNVLKVKGEKGELSRVFSNPRININLKGKVLMIQCTKPRRKDKALFGTYLAHIKNMVKGVTSGFEYKMKTVFSHFPIKTAVENNEFLIQNFLGERSARRAKILEGVNIEIKGEDITVNGIDKEKVGQTVANIERATSVKYRDIRVFQDGVYRVNKG